MKPGEAEKICVKNDVRLIKVRTLKNEEVYHVISPDEKTKCYKDYDDALEEYNLRWMKIEYGE